MNAVLNLYDGCESEKPVKTFTCRRLTMQAANTLEELTGKVTELEKSKEGKSLEEIKAIDTEITRLGVEILQSFFPSFTEEDFNKLDPYEYQEFCYAIGEERARILKRAQKN